LSTVSLNVILPSGEFAVVLSQGADVRVPFAESATESLVFIPIVY